MIARLALLVVTVAVDGGAIDAAVPADAGGDARAPSVDGAGDGAGPDAGAPDGAGADAVVAAPPAQAIGRLAGHVLTLGTRKPVSGALLIADVSEVGVSDAQGAFTIEIPCGLRRLSIQASGFERLVRTVDACAGVTEPMTFRLMPSEHGQAYETVVRSKPAHAVVKVEAEELVQTPGTLGDPLRVIESLPGVATVVWPAPIYAVRGSNPGNTGFFLDGVRVPALFHFALGPSVVHPYFFQGLEFFPGGYPARYGRYVAGIVTAETRAAAEDRVHSAVDVRLYDAGALVSAPLPGGGGVAVAGRYSYTGGLFTLLNNRARLDYWDYQLRADRRVGPFQLTLLAFGSGDVLSPDRERPATDVALGFHRVSLRVGAPVGGGRVVGSLAVGTDHSRAPINDAFPITVDALGAAPRLAYLRSFEHADVALGFDGEVNRYEAASLQIRPTGAWDLGRRRVAVLLAGYASATVRAGGRVLLTPELRYDSYTIGDARAQDLAPRLTARLKLADDLTLKGAGGRFTQAPSVPLQIPGVEAFGLGLFGLQTSWQASLGIETGRLPGFDIGLTGFLQRYVLTDLRDPTPGGADPLAADFLARRDGVAYGIELLARRPQAYRLHGWLSYTLSKSVRSLGGGAVGPSDWDQRHILNLVVAYRFGRTTFGARFHLNTGRPFVTANAAGDGFRRLPPFYQLDLRVDRRIIYARFILNFYAELVNATLSRQVYGVMETLPGEFQERSFSIVIPSIGVRGEF